METIVSILKFLQSTTHDKPSPRRRSTPLLRTARRRPEEKTVLPRVVHLPAAPPHSIVLEALLVGELFEGGLALLLLLPPRRIDRGVGDGCREAARRRWSFEGVIRRPARVRQRRCSAGRDRCGCEPRHGSAPRRRVERAGAAGEPDCCQDSAAMTCATGASPLPPPSARRAAAGLHDSSEHNSAWRCPPATALRHSALLSLLTTPTAQATRSASVARRLELRAFSPFTRSLCSSPNERRRTLRD